MNKDTIIGFVLIALVLIGFSWWNQPSAEEIEAARKQDSIAAAIKDNAAKQQQADEAAKKAQAEAAAKGDSTALFFSALNGQNQNVVLKNDKVELTFSTKGGSIAKAVIKGRNTLRREDSADELHAGWKVGEHHYPGPFLHTFERIGFYCYDDSSGW